MKITTNNYQNYAVITDGSKALEFAKKELQTFINRCCGFTLPDYQGQAHFISLGVNEKSKTVAARYDFTQFREDGYVIVCENENVYILAENARAVIFGVYGLLEEFLGVRFVNDHEHTPKNEYVQIDEGEYKRIPCSEQRIYLSYAGFEKPTTPLHCLRYKFTGDYAEDIEGLDLHNKWYKGIPNSHNSNYYVPVETWGEKHPEFFSINRYGNFRIFESAVELCYTNGVTDEGEYDESKDCSVVSVTADSFMRFMEADPYAKYFMFGRVDNSASRCHCPRCEAARLAYGDSGIMIVFLNAVIGELRRRFAKAGKTFDKKIVTFAYSATVNPPVKDGKPITQKVVPDKDLYIRFAPIDADFTYSMTDERQKSSVREQFEGWTSLTKNIMLWDYNCNYNECLWYFPNLSYLKENICLYADLGMNYIMKQGSFNVGPIWLDELKCYVASRLYWDLSLNTEDLIKEYVTIYFGMGAPAVLSLIEKMETHYKKLIAEGFHLDLGGANLDFFAPDKYSFALLAECENLIESAIENVQSAALSTDEKNTYVKRLKTVLATPVRMILRNAYAYFGKESEEYEDKFFRLADEIGLKLSGEVVPIYIDLASKGVSRYKIITGQTPTDEVLCAAKYLQAYIQEKTGVTVPIGKDNEVFPAYWEYAIMIGKNTMTNEFYKKGLDLRDCAYYIDVKGWCVFIDSEYDVQKAVRVFAQSLLRKGDEDNSLEIVSRKRIGKLEEK